MPAPYFWEALYAQYESRYPTGSPEYKALRTLDIDGDGKDSVRVAYTTMDTLHSFLCSLPEWQESPIAISPRYARNEQWKAAWLSKKLSAAKAPH